MSEGEPSIGGVLGTLFVGGMVLVAIIPKPVWIFIGVTVAAVVVIWIVAKSIDAADKRSAEAEAREHAERAANAAADKREREQRVRREQQERIDTLGKQNAALVESALGSIRQVSLSEAARSGWLGDVDFSADIKAITENFAKAHALRGVTDKLSALDKPSADDRRILAEARTTTANLERIAFDRVTLISSCAIEARLIDASLRAERQDAKVAEQRAELHAKLSAMLYGIEAAPTAEPIDSAVDAVLARVQAYREIKSQIERARSGDGLI